VVPFFYPFYFHNAEFITIDGKPIFEDVHYDVVKVLGKEPCQDLNRLPEEYRTPLFARILAEHSGQDCEELVKEPGRPFSRLAYNTFVRNPERTLMSLLFNYTKFKVSHDVLDAINMDVMQKEAKTSEILESSLYDPFLRSAYSIILRKLLKRLTVPSIYYKECGGDLKCTALMILSNVELGRIRDGVEIPEDVEVPCESRFSHVAGIRFKALERCVKEGKQFELSLLLDLLSAPEGGAEDRAWDLLPQTGFAYDLVVDLLSHEDETVRLKAWLRSYRFLPVDTLRERARYFVRLLFSTYMKVYVAWEFLPTLAKMGVIPREYLVELLMLEHEFYRTLAWSEVAGNVMGAEEVRDYVEYHLPLLRLQREDHRLKMWSLLPKLINLLPKDVVRDNLSYFVELLRSEDEEVREGAWKLMPALTQVIPIILD
jgi:hypothetical protein